MSGRRSRGIIAFVAMLAAGCGGGDPAPEAPRVHPVSGRVVIAGKPAAGVEVRLHPLNVARGGAAPSPSAKTDKDGRFRLSTEGLGEGAPNGQYLATLVWPSGRGGDRLDGAFAEPGGSGLAAAIDDATSELPTFEVAPGGLKK